METRQTGTARGMSNDPRPDPMSTSERDTEETRVSQDLGDSFEDSFDEGALDSLDLHLRRAVQPPPVQPPSTAPDEEGRASEGAPSREEVVRGVIRARGQLLAWDTLALRRLAWVSWVGAIISAVAWALSLLRQPNAGVRVGTERPVWMVPVFGLLCLGMAVVARRERLSAKARLDMGLVLIVVCCFMVSYFRHSLPYAATDVMRGTSPMSLAILFFAIVVPVQPARMAVAAVAAALTDPLALALTVWRGNPNPPWNLWLWLMIPNAFAAPLAYFTTRFLHQIGESVTKARALGQYQLVEKIGEGGMGEVWRARHQMLRRSAAIKLIHAQVLGSSARVSRTLARFEREVQATSDLRSPNTVEVFDYGVAEDGTFYYVMEMLEGVNLQQLVSDHGPLPPERAVHLLRQVCHSLREAHARGLIHRDIKPANIHVCRMGLELDVVKVLDFGLVKQLADATDEGREETLTRDGAMVGTPGFMAPEVIEGGAPSVGLDIYALGCVAFWMLTGRLVFEAETALMMFYRHVNAEPQPPSALLDEPLPEGLDALILACLSKEPDARPPSIDAVEERLERVQLASPWTRQRAARWWAGFTP